MVHHRLVGLLGIIALGLAGCAGAEARDKVFLFPYFDSNGENGVFLAWSEDGTTFHLVNGGKPVFSPADWDGQNLTRDPSIVYHDGVFHMVWTSSWWGRVFGYARSADLKTWSAPRMVTPFEGLPEGGQPRNIWAPELHFDPAGGGFFIVWASITGDMNRHRQFFTLTNDFENFTQARVFFDQGWSVIDAHTVFDDRGTAQVEDDRWVMVVKNEEETGNGGKNLRLTMHEGKIDFENYDPAKWSGASEPVVGPGSSIEPQALAEGQTLLKHGGRWLLYWDKYQARDWGMAWSADLGAWTNATGEFRLLDGEGREIAHPRHGTIFRAPRAAVAGFKEIGPGP